MDLSLNAAELEHLGALGVTVGADGSMRSASGRQITPGTAVQLLAKSAVSGPGPAGPLASAGSGTADAAGVRGGPVAGLDGGSGDEIDPDITGIGDDAAALAKEGLLAASFRRHALTAGHQSDSPANGPQRIIPAPHMNGPPGGEAHVAEPQAFGRGPLTAGHASEPPADDPGGNNPCRQTPRRTSYTARPRSGGRPTWPQSGRST